MNQWMSKVQRPYGSRKITDGRWPLYDRRTVPGLDESSDAKYEYLDGSVFLLHPPSSAYDDDAIVDMAGRSQAHATVRARMAPVLGNALDDSSYSVYTSDARMKLAEKRSLYPNVSVACEEQTGTLLTNPIVVIDVLSPTTEKRDRGAKFNA
jgi:Uma2 family endonuclease